MNRIVERIWAEDGVAALALTPLSWLFGAGVAVRNALFAAGVLQQRRLALPAVSVGNLSVGGTGKTPVSAWVAAELLALGARPAIVMRGYGADEPLVHSRLNPHIPVVVNPDRVAGTLEAKRLGASVAVLDDAFQHRAAARDVDLVLVAAEQGGAHRLLPAGPLREGRSSLRRATVVIVTRKSATLAEAEAVAASWTGFAGAPPAAIVALLPGELRMATGPEPKTAPRRDLADARVLAVSAIGNPLAFSRQLEGLGAQVTVAGYPDHHAFTAADAAELAERGAGHEWVVCTLKDAVKLAPLWPREAAPLWYLSQAVEVERGAALIREALRRLVPGPQP